MKKTHLLILLVFLFSCKKEKQIITPSDPPPSVKQEAKIIFSKALAVALEHEPSLRSFIKSEALKKFDNDYDVLLQSVLYENLGSETVSDILFKYAPSKIALEEAIESLPTLTIFVPEVPNFSPETWDTSKEIPMVAVAPENKSFNNVHLYNSKLELTKVPYGLVPGFPVVVVKENERVIIASNSIKSSSNKSSLARTAYKTAASHKYNFEFVNAAFDGLSNKSENLNTAEIKYNSEKLAQSSGDNRISRIVRFPLNGIIDYSYFSLDERVVTAFNKDMEWQRDYIYYGIDPAAGVTKGKFNNRYVEHITAIKINVPETSLSDSPEDPTGVTQYQQPRGSNPSQWTDGNFEVRVNILINAKAGAGPTLEKVFSISPGNLYDVRYEQQGVWWYKVSSTPKEYVLPQPEPIVPWDLENYGSQWKFLVSEFDNASTVTNIHKNVSKYATNFNFDIGFGDKVKVGAKFGSTVEETEEMTYQIVTTMISDQLGEGILTFGSPVILRRENNVPYDPRENGGRPPRDNPNGPWFSNRFITNDVSGGSFTLSIEPKYR